MNQSFNTDKVEKMLNYHNTSSCCYTHIYIYIRVSVGLRNTKECSMSYRQSEMYKLTTYLKDLPQQSVSSKKNLQVNAVNDGNVVNTRYTT